MNPDFNGPQPNYGPAPTPIASNPLGGSFNQNTKRNKIIVSALILGILLIVIIGFIFITNRKDPNAEGMKKVIATHMEIKRISNKALESDSLNKSGANQASRAKIVANSNIIITTKILNEEYNDSLSKEFEEESINPQNDEKIDRGILLNNLDEAYLDILKSLLTEAYSEIGEVQESDPAIVEQLKTMAESNETIFNSL